MNMHEAYNWKEEVANAVTHGIGFLLSIPALIMLIIFAVQRDNPVYLISFLIYGISLVLLYFCSTMLHSFKPGKAKQLFNILDHVAIYVLIAGSYTPLVLITLQGSLGWTLFGVIWGLAAAGIVYKCFLLGKWQIVSTLFYLLMGWLVMIAIKPLYQTLDPVGFWMLVTGGIMFTVGAVFYSIPKVPYMHTIWHLFVIAGTGFMYFCILFYV
ncbi:hemolysin III family protein [Listeria booriae]|nr:hemolysin III family protein [Listeria booriae]MBC1209728.1 hemolysin III family protein [Listeria booriae]